MTQIRLKENMTRDEALMLLEAANREVEMLNQRLAEHEETIEQLEDTKASLRDENRQMKLEMEAIGAGGVSSQRITGTDSSTSLGSSNGNCDSQPAEPVKNTCKKCNGTGVESTRFHGVWPNGEECLEPIKCDQCDGFGTTSAAEPVKGLSAGQLAEILTAYITPEIIGEALEKLENAPWELSAPVKVPNALPSGTKYSVEPHGNGYAIYQGRDGLHHGANLAHLTECTPEFSKRIESALNAMSEPAKPRLKVSYDDKHDVLYVDCDSNEPEPFDAEEDDKGILYRRAISDGRLVGITVMNFMGPHAESRYGKGAP